MAYQKDWRDEEAPGAAADPTKQNTSGVVNGQTAADATAAAGSPTPAPTPSQEGTGSGFVNLQAYMDNNKGEGGRMVNDATAGLSSDADKFGTTAAQTVTDQTKAMQAATGSDKLPGLKSGLASDATANAPAARDFVNSATYTGPTGDSADAGLAAQQKDLAGKLGAVSNDSVVQGLKDKSGAPYSSGFGYLDKFLTGDQSGQAALSAIHGKAATVNAEGGAAADQLGENAAVARLQLAENQQAVKDAAAGRITDITGAGTANAAKLNAGLDRANYTGVVDHGLAGGLSDKDRSDLAALSAITGTGPNAAWYQDPYSQGTAKPIQEDTGAIPAAAVAAAKLSPAQQAVNAAANAPALLAKGNQSATGGVNAAQTAGVNAVNNAQTQATNALGDPTLAPITQGVNAVNSGVNSITTAANQAPAQVLSQAAGHLPTPKAPDLRKPPKKWHP